jgi:hypothetical protein
MDEPLANSPTVRTSHTDPEYLPPAAVAAMLRSWESVLANRYPGTRWTLTYDASG